MQTVVQTPTFLADAKAAGVTDDEMSAIVSAISADPEAGDVIQETGGARKVRIGGKGKGKSGGYRIITFYAAPDVPVFLLALVSKGQRADSAKPTATPCASSSAPWRTPTAKASPSA